MIKEIQDRLGFQRIELGHGTSVSLLADVAKMVEKGETEIVSLHNFCPLPVEVNGPAPDVYTFTSHRAPERSRAMRLTKQTIDFAERLNARYVIIHGGRVPIRSFTRKLVELAKQGKASSKQFARIKIEALQKRRKIQGLYLRRTIDALKELCEYAEQKGGIRLALESRDTLEKIPLEDELSFILDEVNSPLLGYWHDWGHTQIKENLFAVNHEEWLREWGPRALGCHLQDTLWPDDDHRLPLRGQIDFKRLVRHFLPGVPFVWELSPRCKADDIIAAREAWVECFGEAPA